MKHIKILNKEYELVSYPKYYPSYQMVMVEIKDGNVIKIIPLPSKYEIFN